MSASRRSAPRAALLALAMVLTGSLPAHAGLAIHGPATYTPGDVVTITLTGDSEGRLDSQLFAYVGFAAERGSLVPVAATPGDLQSDGFFYWTYAGPSGRLQSCGGPGLGADECVAAHAFNNYVFGHLSLALTLSTLSTWAFDTSGARGDLVFTLAPVDTFDGTSFFDFPAATPLVVVGPIPEPGTVALVGLGVVAIGVARRGGRV